MESRILFKRGNASQNNVYLGRQGEITIDTTNLTLRIHDGVTIGGHFLLSFNSGVDAATVESIISGVLLIHSLSDDHDGRYYTKNEITNLLENISIPFDAQNTPLLVDGVHGWKDLVTQINVRGSGSNSPPWSNFRNGIFAYEFRTGRSDEFWGYFHIDHDYALGTKIYPHVHWSPNTTVTGTVRWGFEYTLAKGHNQASGSVFGPTSIIYATTNITTNKQYTHFITEMDDNGAIDSPLLEPDTLVLIRFFRDGVNDTFPHSIFGFTADLHYQTARIATKNKAPNFFGD